jgi:outer membrane protein
MITDFGRTRRLVDSAQLHAEAQNQVVETARADILIATSRAYFSVLRAESVLTVARQTVDARQVVVDQITALARAQLKSQLDVSFAAVNLSDARLLLVQATNAVTAAEADLANALGLPAQTSFALSEEPMPAPPDGDVETLVQDALRDRPELQDLRLEQRSAESLTKAEHDLSYPTVSAAAAAGFVPAGEAAVPGRYGAAGINMSIPIFNGGLFRARQTEAEFKAKADRDRVVDMANRITRDVRVAFVDAQTAMQRVTLTDEMVAQARQALDLAQGRYDLGLGSIVELSQAQLSLTTAQIGSSTAKYEYALQRAVLDYQTGAMR